MPPVVRCATARAISSCELDVVRISPTNLGPGAQPAIDAANSATTPSDMTGLFPSELSMRLSEKEMSSLFGVDLDVGGQSKTVLLLRCGRSPGPFTFPIISVRIAHGSTPKNFQGSPTIAQTWELLDPLHIFNVHYNTGLFESSEVTNLYTGRTAQIHGNVT